MAGLAGSFVQGDAKHTLKLDGQVRAHDSYLNISSLEAVVDGQKLALEGEADLRDTDAPSAKGVLTADKLAYEGYKLEKLRLPFRGDKKEIILENVAAAYGGGAIKGNATYSLEEKVLTGDLELKDVTHVTPDRPKDDVHINAKLALLAKVLEDKLQLHAATEAMELEWRGLKINRMSLDGVMNEQGLVIDHFSAFAGQKGVLLASGSINPEGELKLKGRMADFPINPVLAAAGKEGSGLCSTGFAIGGKLTAPEFAGVVQLSQAEFMEQKIKEAHGFVSLKDNLLTIKNFRANMEQGHHIVSGSVDLQGEEPYVDLSLETYGVRIEPIMRLLLGKEEVPATGNLDNIM